MQTYIKPTLTRQKRYKLYNQLCENKNVNKVIFSCAEFVFNEVCSKLPWLDNLGSVNGWCYNLIKYGDLFIRDDNGTLTELYTPCTYRIETIGGKIVEFQHGQDGPDFKSLVVYPIESSTEKELLEGTAARFKPDKIIHIRGLKTKLKGYYPYSRSILDTFFNPDLLQDDTVDQFIKNMYNALSEWQSRGELKCGNA